MQRGAEIKITETILWTTKKAFIDFSIVTQLVIFAEDLYHSWRAVTNSNGSFISPNSSKLGEISKI